MRAETRDGFPDYKSDRQRQRDNQYLAGTMAVGMAVRVIVHPYPSYAFAGVDFTQAPSSLRCQNAKTNGELR